MTFFKKKLSRKFVVTAIVAIFAVFLATTRTTHAFLGISVSDITGGFVSTLAFYASTVIAGILGILVAIEAWFIQIVLDLNDVVFQTTFVQTGFSISLSIANLAFVAGIIVIAIATIIRNENYGIKKLLWKLVVAAVLVNFGLVIAAPIFGLANSFTHYFLNCINPAAGGCTQSATSLDSYGNFATSFAGAFQPQDNFTTLKTATTKDTGNEQKQVAGAFSALGADFGKTMVPVAGIAFVVINLTLVIVVLAGFFILMLVRFLYVSILAILMPFAWASWVFPAFGDHWKKWWDKFLQWTFFAPMALFFIYLAMLLMQASKGTAGLVGGLNFDQYNTGTISSSITAFFTGLFSPILTASVQEIVFAGLIIGGLIAANSMGIKMAGGMVSAVEKRGKAFAASQGKKGAKAIGDKIRTSGRQYNAQTKESTTRFQRFGSRLQGIPLLRGTGSKITNWSAPKAIEHDRAEDIKKYTEENLKNLDNAGLLKRAESAKTMVAKAAAAQEIAKRNLTDTTKPLHVDPALMHELTEAAEHLGNMEQIIGNRPDLMPAHPGQTSYDAIGNAVKLSKGDIVNINPKLLNTGDLRTAQQAVNTNLTQQDLDAIIGSLSTQQLSAIGNDQSKDANERKTALIDGIRSVLDRHGLRRFNTATRQWEWNDTVARTKPEFKSIKQLIKSMDTNPNWGVDASDIYKP